MNVSRCSVMIHNLARNKSLCGYKLRYLYLASLIYNRINLDTVVFQQSTKNLGIRNGFQCVVMIMISVALRDLHFTIP